MKRVTLFAGLFLLIVTSVWGADLDFTGDQAGRRTEQMNIPIVCIIDDPAPCINVYWWHVAEPQNTDKPKQQSGEPILQRIPLSFLREFVDVAQKWGIKGKFSVLPYPAGLGSIAEGLPGYPRSELDEWLDVVRQDLTPLFDITPEILTHAKAIDLSTMTLLPENERDWAVHQTEATLTPYIAHALQILKDVRLDASGVTSPWDFGKAVESDYQRAIFNAQKSVNNRTRTWYFLHTSTKDTLSHSKVVYRAESEGKEEWLVSIVSQCSDFLWQTMDVLEPDDEYIHSIADRYLTADGKSGRLVELFEAGVPIVFHTHWQSLFSNGRKTGLLVMAEVGERVQKIWGDKVKWTTCYELAKQIAAK